MNHDMGASAVPTGLADAEASEPSGLGPSGGIPSAEERQEIELLLKHYGGEIGHLAFFALRVGRFLERKAVAGWLEQQGDQVFRGGHPLWESGAYNNLYRAALRIERAEHLASAINAAKPARREAGSTEGESAGPQDDAQPVTQPVSEPHP